MESPQELVERANRGTWVRDWLPYMIGVPLCLGLLVTIMLYTRT